MKTRIVPPQEITPTTLAPRDFIDDDSDDLFNPDQGFTAPTLSRPPPHRFAKKVRNK